MRRGVRNWSGTKTQNASTASTAVRLMTSWSTFILSESTGLALKDTRKVQPPVCDTRLKGYFLSSWSFVPWLTNADWYTEVLDWWCLDIVTIEVFHFHTAVFCDKEGLSHSEHCLISSPGKEGCVCVCVCAECRIDVQNVESCTILFWFCLYGRAAHFVLVILLRSRAFF